MALDDKNLLQKKSYEVLKTNRNVKYKLLPHTCKCLDLSKAEGFPLRNELSTRNIEARI